MNQNDILDLYYQAGTIRFNHSYPQLDQYKRDYIIFKTLGLIEHDRYLLENSNKRVA